jgi:hypothetical protein
MSPQHQWLAEGATPKAAFKVPSYFSADVAPIGQTLTSDIQESAQI